MSSLLLPGTSEYSVDECDRWRQRLTSRPPSSPYLCQINSLIPALLAGNSVILKPSPQTPSTAFRLRDALVLAGLPADVVQVAILDEARTLRLVADPRVGFVTFTGSVAGGKKIEQAVTGGQGFKGACRRSVCTWPRVLR